jgi:hypothetical protein
LAMTSTRVCCASIPVAAISSARMRLALQGPQVKAAKF